MNSHINTGGAGGKGVWGKLGDELYVNGVADERDPNYDSDTTVSVIVSKIFLSVITGYARSIIAHWHRRLF